MKWETLTTEQYNRLCECRSLKSDILPIATAYMYEDNRTPEDALITTLEHLDANNQFFDLSKDEWSHYLKRLERRYV